MWKSAITFTVAYVCLIAMAYALSLHGRTSGQTNEIQAQRHVHAGVK
jgi:hypothetical protein